MVPISSINHCKAIADLVSDSHAFLWVMVMANVQLELGKNSLRFGANTERLEISGALNDSYPSLTDLKPCMSGNWFVF